MTKSVYVVTMPELGWDCVVGVYSCDEVTKESLCQEYPYPEYIIDDQPIQVEVE